MSDFSQLTIYKGKNMHSIFTANLAKIIAGELYGRGDLTVNAVSIDSRVPCPQGIFFALRGENFDGHDYLNNAIERGCVAVVVEKAVLSADLNNMAQIVVPDSKKALGDLAKWWRNQLDLKMIAITGSSGKTTLKEMTANILKFTAHRNGLPVESVTYTQGNLNNDIGVPLTLLRLTEKTKYAIVELGANHLHEIAYTTALVQPDVAVVNNFAKAHLEGFGSLKGVAQAKGEIFQGLKANGVAVINLDCHSLEQWQSTIGERKIQTFSKNNHQADYYAKNQQVAGEFTHFTMIYPQGQSEIKSAYMGEHNVANALSAAALAMNIGATIEDVQQGLKEKMVVKGRLLFEYLTPDLCLIDDTYNANVASMQAGINVLASLNGVKILVLGDMGELGAYSEECHHEVGKFAQNSEVDYVFTLGEKSQIIAGICANQSADFQGKGFLNIEDLMECLEALITNKLQSHHKVNLLVKGSRSMRMERIIDLLKKNLTHKEQGNANLVR